MSQHSDFAVVFGPAALIHLRCALDLLGRMKALVPAAHTQQAVDTLEQELAAVANTGGNSRAAGEILEAALTSLGKKPFDIFFPTSQDSAP